MAGGNVVYDDYFEYMGQTAWCNPDKNPTPVPEAIQNNCSMTGYTGVSDSSGYETCTNWQCPAGYNCDISNGLCIPESPILIDLAGNGFSLTSAAQGVVFDLNGTGQAIQLAWTSSNSDDGWLALDRNGNGRIDSGQELFGNFTPQPAGPEPNGFLALAEYDNPGNGGDRDGRITAADAIYSRLRLWVDANHNGVSESSELFTLADKGIVGLGLNYRTSPFVDSYGNRFKYKAPVIDARGYEVGKWAFDVFLTHQP